MFRQLFIFFTVTLIFVPATTFAAEQQGRLSPQTQQTFSELFVNLSKVKAASLQEEEDIHISRETYPEDQSISNKLDIQVTMGTEAEKEKVLPYKIGRLQNQAYDAMMDGNLHHAGKLYTRILKTEPNYIPGLFGLATVYHKLNKLEQASQLYGKILRLQPTHIHAFNNFLAIAGEIDPNTTLNELKRLSQAAPQLSVLHAQIAVIHYNNGRLLQAAKALKKAIILSPYNFTYRYNFAVMLDQLGKTEKAIQAYEQLLTVDQKGYKIPGSTAHINERLNFLRNNR